MRQTYTSGTHLIDDNVSNTSYLPAWTTIKEDNVYMENKTHPKKPKCWLIERRIGDFSRVFTFPLSTDGVVWWIFLFT